jgi:erythromycin esterase-like protein
LALALFVENFASILNAVGDAEVVMIGEATHGTEEFYHLR